MSKGIRRKVAWLCLVLMLWLEMTPIYAEAATYKNGSYGSDVMYLQQNLAFLGCSPGSADGSYGAKTDNAVKSLQKMLHMEETGIVNDTLDMLIKETVRDVQKYLQNKGYYSGDLDGIKGTAMATAYKKMQKEFGYKQTGIFDLEVAKNILNDDTYTGTLIYLQEFVDRCDGVYEEKIAEYMHQMEERIRKLELVNAEGIATTNITVELSNLMSEVSTKNSVWKSDSMPKMRDAVKYSADLLLTLYNTILSDSMRLQKLQEIENIRVAECQGLIDGFFEEAYQALDNMNKYDKISSKNRERAGKLSTLLKEYQECLPSCQEVFDYAVELLKTNGGSNIYTQNGFAYFVCENFNKKYVYDQNVYSKFEMPGRGNVGCTATALAISYSIYNNLFLMPDDEAISWNEETYVMVDWWAPHMGRDVFYHTDVKDKSETIADDRLNYIYNNYVVADIPVVIRLERVYDNTKGADNGHSVVVVGIRLTADLNNLTYDDFLVADPNGAEISTLTESMKNGKYKLSSGWYLFYPKEVE